MIRRELLGGAALALLPTMPAFAAKPLLTSEMVREKLNALMTKDALFMDSERAVQMLKSEAKKMGVHDIVVKFSECSEDYHSFATCYKTESRTLSRSTANIVFKVLA